MTAFEPKYLFLDLETTGLHPECHEIIEIGAVEVSADLSQCGRGMSMKVRPSRIEMADPEALRINGYSEDEWGGAHELSEAVDDLRQLIQPKIIIAGWHPEFDTAFLDRVHIATNRRRMDVCSAVMLMVPGLENYSMTNVAKHFGVPDGGHRAFDDAFFSLQIARMLRDRFGVKA